MRSLRMMALLAPLALAACGGEDRTVVVNPAPAAAPTSTMVQPGSTVVVPPSATVTRVCPPGAITC